VVEVHVGRDRIGENSFVALMVVRKSECHSSNQS
jgi:hypothetical protein